MADRDIMTKRPVEAATNAQGSGDGLDRAKGIVVELADATRSVAESLADEQRQRAARRSRWTGPRAR